MIGMFAFIMIPESVYFLAAGVAAVIIIVSINSMREKKRSGELSNAAISAGLNFADSATVLSSAAFPATALFQHGHARQLTNAMTGSFSGLPIRVFDYRYTVGGGRNAHTYKQTVAAFTLGGAQLTEFQLGPSGFLHKMAEAFVHKDLKFESSPDFSKRFELRGPDAAKIRDLFTPELLSYLESTDPARKWHIEGNGETLIVYGSERRVAAQDLRVFLEETSTIANSFRSLCGKPQSAC